MKLSELTHAQVGALLAAMGRAMIDHNVPAEVTLDGNDDEQLIGYMEEEHDIAPEIGRQLVDLANADLQAFVGFNELDHK